MRLRDTKGSNVTQCVVSLVQAPVSAEISKAGHGSSIVATNCFESASHQKRLVGSQNGQEGQPGQMRKPVSKKPVQLSSAVTIHDGEPSKQKSFADLFK